MEETPNVPPTPKESTLETEREPATGNPLSPSRPIPTDTDDPRKSYVKSLLIGGGIVIVIALGVAGALLYLPNSTTPASVASTTSTTKTTGPTNNQTVNDLTSTLTNGTNGETSLTNTNNSSDASATSQAAGNVGDSINENNF